MSVFYWRNSKQSKTVWLKNRWGPKAKGEYVIVKILVFALSEVWRHCRVLSRGAT